MSSTNRLKKLHAKCLNFDTMEFPPYIECDMSKKGNPINSVNVSEMTLTKLHLKNRMKTNDRFYYNADTNCYYEIPNGDRHYFDVTDDFDWDTVIKTNTIQDKDTNTERLHHHRRYETVHEKCKIYPNSELYHARYPYYKEYLEYKNKNIK